MTVSTYTGNRQRQPREDGRSRTPNRAATRTGRGAPPEAADVQGREVTSPEQPSWVTGQDSESVRWPRGERARTTRATSPGSLAQPQRVKPGSRQHTQAVEREIDELIQRGVNIQRQRAYKQLQGKAWNIIEGQARRWLGVPYRWGGTNPSIGLDCSAYVQLVYRSIGIDLPRVSRQQARTGVEVAGGLNNAQPGDLVFYSRGGVVHHVGIYAGRRGGRHVFYNAPRTGASVRLEAVQPSRVSHVRRVIPEALRQAGVGRGSGRGGSDWRSNLDRYEAWIIQRESSFRPTADNPRSSAFGLGQLIYANRVRYGRQLGISPNTTNPYEQLAMFRAYVRDRYGSSRNAYNFWRRNGWY